DEGFAAFSRQEQRRGLCYCCLVPTVPGSPSAEISRVNRPNPAGLACHVSAFPDSAARVPEANLISPFPEASTPAGLPSFITTDPLPSVIWVAASPPAVRIIPPPDKYVP